jgi:putative ABC transport system substrate-binding protein
VFPIAVDPVGAGFVESLARPGGNATGFLLFEYGISGKWLELLKEIAPKLKRVAILRDPSIAAGSGQLGAIQSVAPSLGVDSPVTILIPVALKRKCPERSIAGGYQRVLLRGYANCKHSMRAAPRHFPDVRIG